MKSSTKRTSVFTERRSIGEIFTKNELKTVQPKILLIEKRPILFKKLIKKCRVNSSTYELPRDELIKLFEKILINDEMILINDEMILMAEVVASYENLIFDFDCNSEVLNSPDYLYSLPGYGLDLIYIPINCESEKQKIEKLVFELTRCAMQIVYENNCLPYFEHQKVREEKLIEIFRDIKDKPTSYESENIQISEIIPQYFAAYFGSNRAYFKIHKSIHIKNIPEYFNKFIQPDLLITDGNEIRELNRKFCLLNTIKSSMLNLKEARAIIVGHWRKNVFIKSNVPCLVMKQLIEQGKNLTKCFNAENLFVDLNLINFSKIREKYLKIAQLKSIKRVFVDATDCNEEQFKILTTAKPSAPLIVVGTDEKLFTTFDIQTLNFTWSDFSEESQDYLMVKPIKFQHQQVKFGDIFKSKLDDLPSEIIEELCSNHQLVINSPDIEDTYKTIPRSYQIKDSSMSPFYHLPTPISDDLINSYQHYYYTENFSETGLINKVKDMRIILLADDSLNVDKTNALHKIRDELLQGKKFVKFISLRDAIDEKEDDFVKFVSYHIEKNDYDNKIKESFTFESSYKEGNAIIILDGLDNALEPEKYTKLLQSFNDSEKNNQLWIGSSKLLGDKIEKNFNVARVRIAIIDEEQELNYLGFWVGTSLKFACESYINQNIQDIPRSNLHFYALKSYLNESNSEIFGLTSNPLKRNVILEISSAKNIIQFKSPCLLYYLVADFIKITFETFNDNDHKINFFLSILTNKNGITIRKMLNEMDLSRHLVGKNLFRDALLHHCVENKTLALHFERCSNLFEFILELLNAATWETMHAHLASTISKILISIAPYIQNFSNDLCQNFLRKIPANILSEVMTSQTTYDNYRVFELIACFTTDEKYIELILQLYTEHQLSPFELIQGIDNCIYKIAIEQNNFVLIKFLLSDGIITFEKWEKSMKIAFELESFGYFEFIKWSSNNAWENADQVVDYYENKNQEIEQFHDDIKNENIEGIKEFIKNNPNLKICTYKNRVPLQHACLENKYESFEILKINLFEWKSAEETYLDFTSKFESKLNSNSVRTEAYHKGLFLQKCHKSASSKSLKFDDKIIDDLFKLKDVKEVLKTVATTDVTVTFVMDNEILGEFDRELGEFCDGAFYPLSNIMLVSQCKDEATRYGVFAHEATHAAMFFVYGNYCKPYCMNDTIREKEFKQIVKNYKEKYDNGGIGQQIINNVFKCYKPELFVAELIVRIPHILAFFHGSNLNKNNTSNIDPFELLEVEHSDFYNFFREKTLKDLKIVDGVPLRILNDKLCLWNNIGLLEVKFNELEVLRDILFGGKNAILTAEFPQLLLKSIYDILTNLKNYQESEEPSFLRVKSSNIFVDIQELTKSFSETEIKHLLAQPLKSDTLKRIIFYGLDIQENQRIICELFNTHLNKSVQIILINPCASLKSLVGDLNPVNFSFSWLNPVDDQNVNLITLTEKSRVFLANKKVLFQNKEEPKLSEILHLDQMSKEVLNFLITTKNIELKCFIQSRMFYYPRKLLKKPVSQVMMPTLEKLSREVRDVVPEQFKSEGKKIIIISDKHGSGKSAVLKNIYEFQMQDFRKNFWISFVSLDEHEEVLRNFNATMSKKTLKRLLNINSPFKELAFNKFYNNKKVILLLDGVDNLSLQAKQNLLLLINDPKLRQVWLTCQPYIEQLFNALNTNHVYSIKPLDFKEKITYKQQNELSVTEEHLVVLEHLEQLTMIGFPLLISIAAEYISKNPSDIRRPTFFAFCGAFYQNSYQKWLNLNLSRDRKMDFETIHSFYAFVPHFNSGENIFDYSRKNANWCHEDLTACGLLNGQSKIFKTQIIPQYLIINFIKENFTDHEWRFKDEFLKFFCKILTSEDSLKLSRIMLNDILENFENSIIFSEYPKILNDLFTKDENVSKILIKPFAEGHFNICLYALEIIQKISEREKFLKHLKDNFKNCQELAFNKVNDGNREKYNELMENCSSEK